MLTKEEWREISGNSSVLFIEAEQPTDTHEQIDGQTDTDTDTQNISAIPFLGT